MGRTDGAAHSRLLPQQGCDRIPAYLKPILSRQRALVFRQQTGVAPHHGKPLDISPNMAIKWPCFSTERSVISDISQCWGRGTVADCGHGQCPHVLYWLVGAVRDALWSLSRHRSSPNASLVPPGVRLACLAAPTREFFAERVLSCTFSPDSNRRLCGAGRRER